MALAHFLHIGDVDGAVNFLDTAFGVRLGGLGGLLDGASTFNNHSLLLGVQGKNDTTLALVLAGDNEYVVTFLHVGLHRVCFVCGYFSPHYTCTCGVTESTRLTRIRQA